jgi:hypothetical protein
MTPREFKEEVICLVVLMLVLAWVAWEARSFPPRAREFPELIALAAFALSAFELARLTVVQKRRARERPPEGWPERKERTWVAQAAAASRFLGWIAVYYMGIQVVGFLVASFAFATLFLVRVAGTGWLVSVASSGALVTVLLVFGRVLRLAWPAGLLAEWTGIGR